LKLDAHINIRGPNKADEDDEMFMVRRAIMLQGMLKKRGVKTTIEENVLNALLRVPKLRHGARSLEAILAMSELPKNGDCFGRTHVEDGRRDDVFRRVARLPRRNGLTTI